MQSFRTCKPLVSPALVVALALTTQLPIVHPLFAAEPTRVPIQPQPRWPFVAAAPKPVDQGQGGVGIVLEARPDGVYAQQIAPGGPAGRGGVQPGDQLVQIDAWPVPAGTKVPDVAEHIRGKPGTSCAVELRRAGQKITLQLQRVALDRMFPQPAKNLILAKAGVALLATGAKHSLGIRFTADGNVGQLLTYAWTLIEGDKALGSPGAQTGQGTVLVDPKEVTTIQLADWKVDLRGRPDGSVLVTGSNLPVHEVAGDWLQIAPPWPSVVKPRTEPTKRSQRWTGPAKLAFLLQSAGKPLGGHRVTLKLADATGSAQDSQTVQSDAQGRVEVPVPQGLYRIQGLQPSVAGAGRDVYFGYDLKPLPDLQVQAGEAKATVLDLAVKLAPGSVAQLDWAKDPRVGQGLPPIGALRWFGLDKAPATLAGKVLLVDVWATWCGPCRATAPVIAELHARLASKGLIVVAASIDRDEMALEEHAREQLPGGPPIAWVGTDAMETLDTESVPTFFVVDHTGRIRGVHKGTGWSLDAAEAWLTELLDEARAAQKGKK